jgi:acylphosphatase
VAVTVTLETVARELSLRGRVQGVFFRSGAQREAERLGVAGWAANCPDGSLEILLEGRAPDVEALVSYCAHGPRGAHVSHLVVRECPPEGLTGFDIR